MFQSLLVLLSFVLSAQARNASTTPLNMWPMIMAHDAATTYLDPAGLIDHWAKTQPSGGPAQLFDCGARALDWRPSLQKDGSLFMHHNILTIDHNMSDALDDMVQWASHNTKGATDFILLGISDCVGTGCDAAVDQLLATRNVTVVTAVELYALTAQAATELGKLPGGGAMLACHSCWEMHFVPTVGCSGFNGGGTRKVNPVVGGGDPEALTYTCYNDSSTKAFPLNRMWQYLNNVSLAGPPSDGKLYTAQALWQETTDTVIVGELHGSTLLEDESRSQLNALLAERITSGVWNVSRANMVEINNVCDGGLGLKRVLDALP